MQLDFFSSHIRVLLIKNGGKAKEQKHLSHFVLFLFNFEEFPKAVRHLTLVGQGDWTDPGQLQDGFF